jgi:hypothetical protein
MVRSASMPRRKSPLAEKNRPKPPHNEKGPPEGGPEDSERYPFAGRPAYLL